MSERYTESELRLLAQYKVLREIKEGKRELNAPPSAAPAHKPAQQRKPEANSTQPSTVQKLPSKIRLKQSRQAASAEPSSPQAPRSPARQAPQPSGLPAAAAVAAADQPATAELAPVKATISRAELAAALAKRRQQQSLGTGDPLLQKLAAQASASQTATATPTPPAEAPAEAPKQQFKAPSRPQVTTAPQRPAAAVAVAGPSVAMAGQPEQPSDRAPQAAVKDEEIDFEAVSSPEYEVDYDAVSSPEYDVSEAQKQQQQKQQGQQQELAVDDQPQPLATPERHNGPSSSNRTPPSEATTAAVAGQKPPLPARDGTPVKSQHKKCDSSAGPAARRRSRSCSRSPSRSGSRSPMHRHPHSRSRSRQLSPDRRERSNGRRSSRSYRRSCSRSRSRSRSGSRGRDGGSSRSYLRSRSFRQRSRSRDQSRDAPRHRRRSPCYSIGARRTSSRSPSREREQSRGYDSSSDAEHQQQRVARKERRTSSRQNSKQPRPTLFVGDLPPAGFSSEDLRGLFSAYGWSIVNARVMGSQCYGFVEFDNQLDAEEALQLVSDGHPSFAINGQSIRASWARGTMPDWKRGKTLVSRRDYSHGLAGLEAYEHPTARMLRLQAAAAAAQTFAGVLAAEHAEPEEGQLPVPVAAPMPPRPLIDYGDL